MDKCRPCSGPLKLVPQPCFNLDDTGDLLTLPEAMSVCKVVML